VRHQPAADERPDHECNARPRRPGSDRCPALLAAERRSDHREARGREDRARDPLQPAGDDQRVAVGRRRAQDGREAEAEDAEQEEAPCPEQVAERPSDEQQRAERQQVRVDEPLLEREPSPEISLDRRQRDIDDGRVDEDDDGPEDARDENEAVAGLAGQVFDTRRREEGGGWRSTRSSRSTR
jgi:hypothetical protein